jgi:CRP-like cAMP-binding protein
MVSVGGVQTHYPANVTIVHQGESAKWIYYLYGGTLQLRVTSQQGSEAIIGAPLLAGAFFGVATLAGKPTYPHSIETLGNCEVVAVPFERFDYLISINQGFGAVFTAFLLEQGFEMEAELVDHLFNSSEKRLARTLLLLAKFGEAGPLQPITNITQESLARRIGTTRGRVSYFMNKFRSQGLIDYNGKRIKVHGALLGVVLNVGENLKLPSCPIQQIDKH